MTDTTIVFLLDRSGSMAKVLDDTIGGFNAYLAGLQQAPNADSIFFTLIQFDSLGIDKVYENALIGEVAPLTTETFVPRAWTPLLEAAYKAIEAADKATIGTQGKVIICIQTDGEENKSAEEFTWERLNKAIREKTEAGWQFNFMGANLDAYDQGAKLGIRSGATMSYNAKDAVSNMAAYSAAAARHMLYASGQSESTEFTASDKIAAGDAYFQNRPDASVVQPVQPSAAGEGTIGEISIEQRSS